MSREAELRCFVPRLRTAVRVNRRRLADFFKRHQPRDGPAVTSHDDLRLEVPDAIDQFQTPQLEVCRREVEGRAPGQRFQWRDETISTSWNRLDAARSLGRIAERVAKAAHGRVQPMLEINEGAVRPERLNEFGAQHDLPGAPEEERQDTERLVLQKDPPAVARELARAEIQVERAEPDRVTHKLPACDLRRSAAVRIIGQPQTLRQSENCEVPVRNTSRLPRWFFPAVMACLAAAIEIRAQQGSAEQQLLQLERDWCTSSLKRDAALLGRILADDYTGVSNRGVAMTKTETIAGLNDKASSITTCVDTDMKVRVYGDTAVVTGLGTRSGSYQSKPFTDRRFLWTDVFVRRDGRWQCVASQGTLVAAQQK